MEVGHQKLLLDLQLFQQHEGENRHLQSERKGQHLVAGPKIGQGPKGKTIGMVRLYEVFQETIPFRKLL
jgi:hypothetical protein